MSFEPLERESFLVSGEESDSAGYTAQIAAVAGLLAIEHSPNDLGDNYIGSRLHEISVSNESRERYLQAAAALFQLYPEHELLGRDVAAFLHRAGPWRIKIEGAEAFMIKLERFTYSDDIANLSQRTKLRVDGNKIEMTCENVTCETLAKVCSVELEVMKNIPVPVRTESRPSKPLSARRAAVLWHLYSQFEKIADILNTHNPEPGSVTAQTVKVHLDQTRKFFYFGTLEELYLYAYYGDLVDKSSIPEFDPGVLSDQEYTIATKYWKMNGKQIATEKGIHYSRVARLYQSIYKKTEASNRKQLTLLLAKAGVIKPE